MVCFEFGVIRLFLIKVGVVIVDVEIVLVNMIVIKDEMMFLDLFLVSLEVIICLFDWFLIIL